MIEKIVEELYVKGLQNRNFDLIRTICVPEAKTMSAGRDGQFHQTTLEKWSKRFDPKNPPFQKLDYSIVEIDQIGSAAQVKIVFIVDSKRRVIDFLHMLKIEQEWRIVNIIHS
ncbi:MAG: nuclear transport factor 2 family protein [Gemmatimonadota bacterium]|nr:MAG: nuclear transport factor 2 family protein [Gemmatimonadota bacterium]